jgi:hypothetical protein
MNKLRDSKGRFLKWLNFNKVCSLCGEKIPIYSHSKSLCRKCYLGNIAGENNPCWRGGLKSQENYGRDYNRMYRKKRGKFYIQACNNRRKAAGKLTVETIQLVYENNIKKYGTLTCYLCIKPIKFGNDELEHKIPITRGGTNEYKNLGVACEKCNDKKHTKTETEYRKVGVL